MSPRSADDRHHRAGCRFAPPRRYHGPAAPGAPNGVWMLETVLLILLGLMAGAGGGLLGIGGSLILFAIIVVTWHSMFPRMS